MAKKLNPDRMTNLEVLRETMAKHSLDRDDIARTLSVKRTTVDSWLRPAGSAAFRRMPDVYKSLLLVKHPL